MSRFVISATKLGSSVVPGNASASYTPGTQTIRPNIDGQLYPYWVGSIASSPVVSVRSHAVAEVLGALGLTGVSIASLTGGVQYNADKQAAVARAGNGSHFTAAYTTGIAFPTSISAGTSGLATVGYELHAISSDGTDPVTLSKAGNALSYTALSNAYTIGKISINGTDLVGVTSVTINFGISVGKRQADGYAFPTFAAVDTITPTIQIGIEDIAQVNDLTNLGLAQTSSDSIVYLRRVSNEGAPSADSSAHHLSFTVDAGLITSSGPSGSLRASTNITITPIHDGTNAPIVYASGVAIS